MAPMIYKIVRMSEWDEAQKTGLFAGSADDKHDGFIHLSSAAQLRTTLDTHFSGEDNLLSVAVEAERLGPGLKWEVSRRGETFPHLYADLPLAHVHSTFPIRRGPDGRPILPLEIPEKEPGREP
jgi:uncharacterized protein (DUF952 family)